MSNDPAWLVHALAELGVKETPGPVSTKRIIEYRTMAGCRLGGDDGQVPWCAIFVNAMLALDGRAGSGNAMARSFASWGQRLDKPLRGAIVPMKSATRPAPAGHVAIATGRRTATHIEVVGGNQGDRVSIALFPVSLVLGYRWPAGVPLPTGEPVMIAAAAPAKPIRDA